MDKEQINIIKYLVIGSFVFAIMGIIGSVLLRRESPGLASIIKNGSLVIAILIFSIGVVWTIAGESISKKFKNRKSPAETKQEYLNKLEAHQLRIEEMQLQTALKLEEAKQKQLDNQIQMQRAKINQMNAKARSMGGGNSNDILGNLSGFMTSKPQQTNIPNKTKKKKKIKTKEGIDDFFIKF